MTASFTGLSVRFRTVTVNTTSSPGAACSVSAVLVISKSTGQSILELSGIQAFSLAGSCWSLTPSPSASSVLESKASIMPSPSSSKGFCTIGPTSSPSKIPSPSVSGLLGSKPRAFSSPVNNPSLSSSTLQSLTVITTFTEISVQGAVATLVV